MAKILTKYIFSGCLRYVLSIGLFICLSSQDGIAQTNPKSNKDSLKVDSIKLFRINLIDNWNKVIGKEEQIAATSTIYGHDIRTIPVSNLTNILTGRLPGLYTNQNNSLTGYDAASISLRGQTPIFVIDGVVRSFMSFNPADIETITVMKDGLSTAMLGSRSSNGAIYITTRDRSEGDNSLEIGFDAQYGFLSNLRSPNFITGADYATLYNEAQQNTNPGSAPLYSANAIASYRNGTNDPYLNPNTNWYDLVYRNQSSQQRYSVNVAGNSKTYRYYVSLENFNQDGNLLTDPENNYDTDNFYKRYSIRTNAQMNFNDDITVSLNLFGAIENSNGPGATNFSIDTPGARILMSSIFATSPLAYAPRNADGTFGGTAQLTNNILATAISTGYMPVDARSLAADVSLNYKLDDILPGLWAKGLLSINNYYQQYTNRSKTFAIYYPVVSGDNITYIQSGTDGIVAAGTASYVYGSQFKQTYVNFLMGYAAQFGKNNLDVLASYNVDNNIIVYNQLSQIYRNAGITGRYNFEQKYMLELSGVFGSYNRYAPENRWQFLPSLGLAWALNKEKWFHSEWIGTLKLRTTVGQTAWANPNSYYSYIQSYSTSATGYVFGTSLASVSGAAENSISSALENEKAWKYDIGVDATLFKDRLGVSFDYYNNRYYDLIRNPGNGYTTGILGQNYPTDNVGKTRYSGMEVSLNFNNRSTTSLQYGFGLNISIEKSKILSYDEANLPYEWLYYQGSPISAVRGYQAIGFYQEDENSSNTPSIQGYTPQPGDIKYKDLNGDGRIDFLDVTQIGSNSPRIFFGFNFSLAYKNFDLSGLFQGVVNQEVYLNSTQMSAFNNSTGYVLDYTTENRWAVNNTVNATLPRLTLGTNVNNTQVSSFWLRNGNYVRLKNLEFGYSIGSKWIKKAKIKKLRFFINAYNLFTVTALDYLDPESLTSGFSNNRIISGGVTLKL